MGNKGTTSKFLQDLPDRPAVGAKGVFRSLFAKRLKSRWAEWLFGNASWLLIGLVLLIPSLPLPYRAALSSKSIYGLLAVYALYVVFLEIASRLPGSEYDRAPWRIIRIAVNIVMVGALVWFSGGAQSYFWFLYLLPIFQAIVYFSLGGVIFTLAAVLASYWALSWLVAAQSLKPADPILLLVNGIVLSLSALVFHTLFGSVREGDELTYKEMETLRLTALDLTAELEIEQLLRKIVERAVDLLQASGGGVYRLDPSRRVLTVVADTGGDHSIVGYELEVGKGMAGLVTQTGKWMIKDNYGKWPRRAPGLDPNLFKAVVEVPLEASGTIIGVLYVTSYVEGRRFTPRDARLLTLLASQAAVAIVNAETFAEHRKNLRQLELLNRINERLNSALNFDDILQITLEEALKAVRTVDGSVMLFDQDCKELEIKAWVVQGRMVDSKRHKKFALGEGVAGLVAETGRPYICYDTTHDRHFLGSFTGRSIGSLISVPIILHERVFCIINADHPRPHHFGHGDVELLSALATSVASAIESQKLRDIGIALSKLLLEELYPQIVESACILTGSQISTIFLHDEQSDTIRRAALYPPEAELETESARSDGLTRRVLKTGQLVSIPDVQGSLDVKQSIKDRGIRSLMGAPLVVRVGRGGGSSLKTIGVLFVSTSQLRQFGKRDEEVLQSLANQAAIAIDRNRNLSELREKIQFNDSLLESAFDAIVAVDNEERVCVYNRSAEKILGYSREEVYGRPASHFFFDPEDPKQIRMGLKLYGKIVDYRLRVRSKSLESIPILLSAVRLEDGSVGFFKDLRAIESAKQHLQQLTELFEASKAITSADNREKVLDTAADQTMRTLGADLVYLYSYDQEQKKVILPLVRRSKADADAPAASAVSIPAVEGIIAETDICVTEETEGHPLLGEVFAGHGGISSSIGCALRAGDKVVGVIFCGYEKKRQFAEEEKVLTKLFFSGVAAAIENARLYREIQESARVTQGLYKAGMVHIGSLPVDASLQSLLEQARQLTNAEYGALEILPSQLSPETFFIVSGVEPGLREKIGMLPKGEGMLGLLFKPDTVLNLQELRQHRKHTGFPEHHPHMASFLGVSISLEGHGIGNLYVANKKGALRFNSYDEAYLSMLAGLAAAAVERSKSQAEVRAMQTINMAFSLLSRWARMAREQTGALRGKLQELKKVRPEDQRLLHEMNQIMQRMDSQEYIILPDMESALYESLNLSVLLKEVALAPDLRRRLHQAANAAGIAAPVNPHLEIDSGCWVRGNRPMLESAFGILLENAVEAIEEKKAGPVDIAIFCKSENGQVHVRIVDTGPGVPEELQEKLFKLPLHGREGHFGVGSVTAGMIFKLHKGEVRIEKTDDAGTEVVCWLPAE
jgi:PAS domain S-box-containing protein